MSYCDRKKKKLIFFSGKQHANISLFEPSYNGWEG